MSQLRLAADHGIVTAWAGRTPRAWQVEALPLALNCIKRRESGIVSAIMGSGKSVLIAEICASGRGRVLVTVPTVKLVEQMAETIGARCPGEVGCYYTHAKQTQSRITVCCMPSVPTLLADPAWPGPPALWIADEAHRSESATILDAKNAMDPKAAIGFTATPFRAKHTEELSLWSSLVYEYGAMHAIRDGVVVPYELRHWTGRDALIDDVCVQMIREVVDVGPGLCNADTIADAEQFAATLAAAGIPAGVVHSRQPRGEGEAAIARLRAGELKLLVHVNMLSEGVDIPWLRWLCMRRLVRSRVRFCQEVGRVLRASPGKERAILLDPNDLFDSFGLTYEAVLEGMAAPPVEPDDDFLDMLEKIAKNREEGIEPEPTEARILAQTKAWRAYLRRLFHTALAAGVLPEQKIRGTRWRSDPLSGPQLEKAHFAVAGLMRDTSIPLPHRQALTEIAQNIGYMHKGDASDLMTIGFAIRDARRRGTAVWPLLAAAAKDSAP